MPPPPPANVIACLLCSLVVHVFSSLDKTDKATTPGEEGTNAQTQALFVVSSCAATKIQILGGERVEFYPCGKWRRQWFLCAHTTTTILPPFLSLPFAPLFSFLSSWFFFFLFLLIPVLNSVLPAPTFPSLQTQCELIGRVR